MAGETSRTLLRIPERKLTVRSFFEKPSVSIYVRVYVDLCRKYRKKKVPGKDKR